MKTTLALLGVALLLLSGCASNQNSGATGNDSMNSSQSDTSTNQSAYPPSGEERDNLQQ